MRLFFCNFAAMSFLFLDSIGGGEFIFIILIVLMLFGAESIPNIARTLGRGIRQIKDATQEIQRDIANSTDNPIKDFRDAAQEIQRDITSPAENPLKEIKEITQSTTTDVKKTLDQNLDI
jgi:sec-independent protein translocase protein TatA